MDTNKIKIPKEIQDKLIATIPDYLIQQREGGGKKMLSYISGSTVIDMLNSAFGYVWSWKVSSEWITESQDSVNKYVNGSFSKDASKWTVQKEAPVAHVKGVLSVYLTLDDSIVEISKEGYGSKSILGKQNDQESIFKAAGTDALKKAASLFGIGAQLYRNEDEQAYFDEINYENPWTAEAELEHAESLSNLTKYMEMYGASDEELANLVFETTGDCYDVLPDNIESLMIHIEETLNISEQ